MKDVDGEMPTVVVLKEISSTSKIKTLVYWRKLGQLTASQKTGNAVHFAFSMTILSQFVKITSIRNNIFHK